MIACRPSSVFSPPTPLNDFSSETPGHIFKYHVELSVNGGLKICSNGYDLFIKVAACPYIVKTLKNLLLQNQEGRILVYSIVDSSSAKFIQMMTLG